MHAGSYWLLKFSGNCTNAAYNGFLLSGKVVALHFDNNGAKAYSCNQGGTVSLLQSTLGCCMLNLAN